MATATRTKAQEVATGVKAEPRDLDITREDIFQAALWIARNTNRVPTFLGPTASGKTYGAEMIAKQINAEVVTVLLAQHTPDEIAGFQVEINGELVVNMPYWFRESQRVLDRGKSVIIMFDELGLSREETRGALYTFFRDRHLHGHTLRVSGGSEVLLFSASNPAVFSPPFRSRCLFLPVPADRTYLLEMAKGNFGKKILGIAPITNEEDPAYSNAEPPPPITVDASAGAVLNAIDDPKTGFWQMSEGAYMSVLKALVPFATLQEVMRERVIDASYLAQDYDTLLRALRTMPKDNKHSMIGNVIESMPSLELEKRAYAISAIQDVIYDDETADDLLTYFSTPRSESAVQAVSQIDPQFLEKVLRDKELIFVDTDKSGNHKVGGSIAKRIQRMVEVTGGK